MPKKILIVDDEEDIVEFLQYNLEKAGYDVLTATNGSEALSIAKSNLPDLIILDIMMPVLNGIEACKLIREDATLNNSLVVFLTAREEDYMEIEGFNSGGDDYINKPIRPRLLVSKINAMLKPSESADEQQGIIEIGSLVINKENYSLVNKGVSLNLPRKEFELLYMLLSVPGKVFTRLELLNEIWGEDIYVTNRTIDVHIRKLREKIGDDLIKTVKGIGYKFESNGAE